MSSDFPEHSLKSICLLVVDCPHATPKWTDSGVVVLRNQNIKEGRLDLGAPSYTDEEHYANRTKRATPTEGDIVITREAPMGDVCLIPKGLRCCLGQRQVLLRPDPQKVEARFLLFALQSPYIQFQIGWNEGTGSTVSNLRIPVLEALKVPTPPMPLQVEIATALGALDDRIALLRETNVTLESVAQALFKSWFVDFDPVRAKMEGRAPEGIDEATAALFPDGFEASESRLMPRGWDTGVLSTVFGVPLRNGLTRPKSIRGVGVHMVSMGEIFKHSKLGNINMDRVPLDGAEKERTLLEVGDLLFARQSLTLAGAGKCSIVIDADEPRTFESHLIRCRLDRQKADPWYFYYYFQSAVGRRQIESIVEQVAAAGIRGSDLSRIKVLFPPVEIQRYFGEMIAPLESRIAENSNEALSLADIRTTLLPRLISGQLRLSEAQVTPGEELA